MKQAKYYKKLENNRVQCELCPNLCIIGEGKVSPCMGRENIGGELYAINYNQVVSVANDPIEKKPLYHWHPGSMILSVAGNSCNLHCDFCKNWTISQEKVSTNSMTAEHLVQLAKKEHSSGIAYTYTEPLIWFEFVLEASALAKENGLSNVFVTNGCVNPEPFSELLPYIDAMNIDIKSIEPDFYKKECKGKIEPVLETITEAHKKGVLVELTNLLITDLNDSEDQIQQLTDWIANLSVDIPLHFSAYHPSYKLNKPRTPVELIFSVYNIARKKLRYVYAGNVNIPGTGDTYCPKCNKTLIKRDWYRTVIIGIENGKCANCGSNLNIRL